MLRHGPKCPGAHGASQIKVLNGFGDETSTPAIEPMLLPPRLLPELPATAEIGPPDLVDSRIDYQLQNERGKNAADHRRRNPLHDVRPVPVDHSTGANPSTIAVTVITFGWMRSTGALADGLAQPGNADEPTLAHSFDSHAHVVPEQVHAPDRSHEREGYVSIIGPEY